MARGQSTERTGESEKIQRNDREKVREAKRRRYAKEKQQKDSYLLNVQLFIECSMRIYKSKPEFKREPQVSRYQDLASSVRVISRIKHLDDMP